MSQAIYFLMDVAILLGMSKVMIRTRYAVLIHPPHIPVIQTSDRRGDREIHVL